MAKCKYCKKVIPVGASFCSFACKIAFRREKTQCKECGKEFVDGQKRDFCCYRCRKTYERRKKYYRLCNTVHNQSPKPSGLRVQGLGNGEGSGGKISAFAAVPQKELVVDLQKKLSGVCSSQER